METKPTYKELEQRIKELELEIIDNKFFLDAVGETIIVLDMERKVTKLNKAAIQLLGCTEEDIPHLSFETMFPEKEHEKHYAEMKIGLETGTIRPFETLLLTKNGEEITVLISGAVLKGGQNEPIGFVGICRDITERKKAEEALQRAHDELERRVEDRTSELVKANKQLVQEIDDRKKAEEALRESEGRLTAFIESATDGFLLFDSELNHTEMNKAASRITGLERKDVTGKNIIDTVPNIKKTGRYDEYKKVMKTGEPFHIPDLISHPLAYDKRIELKAFKVGDGLGIIFNDITERKQTEEALQESGATLRSIFRAAPTGIGMVGDRVIKQANERLCEMLGYSQEELLGRNARLVYPTDEDFEYVGREKYAQIREKGTGTVETRWLRKDGKVFDVLLSSTPIDPDDFSKGVTFTALDITQRKQAEVALRESEEECRGLYEESKRSEEVYRSLLHSSADAIVIYDFEGRADYISPMFTKLFGWTLEEVRGERIPFLPDSEKESTMAIIRDLVENGTPCHGFETKRYTKEGNMLDVSISASRYDNHEGNPAGTLAILRDISEKRKLEAQLQQAHKMEAIGTLAGGVAHDFNNLMMGMLGNISLIQHETDPDHPNHEKLKKVEELIQSSSKLTSQLLGFARKGKYEVKPTNLNKIVKESSETFGRTRKEITIKHEMAEKSSAVEVDETQIQQVLLNLYINAADAMPGGGNLFLQTTNVTHVEMRDKQYDPKPGNYVMITVTDQGAGMDEKTIGRIFDPFFTTKEMGRGTGLGLASSYGIIKGHGGYIDVDSKKGYGTTFKIYLPASDEQITEAPTFSEQIEEGAETILLVDDEEMVLDVGVKMLEIMGYIVLEAKNGKESIDIYKENQDKIDLVILDMIMPGIGGGEAFDKMKEINPDVNVLLSSGYSIEGRAQEILDRGCKGFIQKPFNLEDLSQKMREILDKD